MKYQETTFRLLALILAIALFAVSCRSGSEDVADATPEPVAETVAAEPTPTVEQAQVTPEPVVTDQDRIDAVVAALDAAVEAGEAPESLIAYDLLDSSVNEEGTVTLTICGWTGDTVFDEVRDSLWRTSVHDNSAITTSHITTPITSGDCLNTHLIETALATVEAFDEYLIETDAEPSSFSLDPRTENLLDSEFREFLIPVFEALVADETYIGGSRRPGPALADLAADLLWRRYAQNGQAVLQFAFCRPMAPDRGTYRGGVLLDDGRSDTSPGLHSIDAVQLQPDPESDRGWEIAGHAALIWSDCTSMADWPGAAGRWQVAPEDFQVLQP